MPEKWCEHCQDSGHSTDSCPKVQEVREKMKKDPTITRWNMDKYKQLGYLGGPDA